jgi:hypothetical protein
MHDSMVLVPERPMQPRLFHERVGYFTAQQMDYGQDEHRAPERRYITRYRLASGSSSCRRVGRSAARAVAPDACWIDYAIRK